MSLRLPLLREKNFFELLLYLFGILLGFAHITFIYLFYRWKLMSLVVGLVILAAGAFLNSFESGIWQRSSSGGEPYFRQYGGPRSSVFKGHALSMQIAWTIIVIVLFLKLFGVIH
jgi:hypothetical protein